MKPKVKLKKASSTQWMNKAGVVIRAFYIIIYTTFIIILGCYLHCYIIILYVLDDLGDFHTKSLFLVFNLWEAENLLFLVFIVSEVSRTQLIKGKILRQFFFERKAGRRTPKTGEP